MGYRSIATTVLVLCLLTFTIAQDLPPTEYFDLIKLYFQQINEYRGNQKSVTDMIDEVALLRTPYPGDAD